jgi:hypothetical protein
MATPEAGPQRPRVGERAEQLVEDALRLVRLTKPLGSTEATDESALRAAVVALAAHYNLPGGEIGDVAALAAWRKGNGK